MNRTALRPIELLIDRKSETCILVGRLGKLVVDIAVGLEAWRSRIEATATGARPLRVHLDYSLYKTV